MAITLTALAREIGVDPSLVSRVLRRDPNARISGEKRAAILALAEKTGYRPNRVARSFRTHRTFILGMLTPHRLRQADCPHAVTIDSEAMSPRMTSAQPGVGRQASVGWPAQGGSG